MKKYRPPRIEDMGLRAYLDSTKEAHGGLMYSDFDRMADYEVNKMTMARKFNVDRRTITKWLAIRDAELQK